jgi:uncharacterized RDD family membrane protein YckC
MKRNVAVTIGIKVPDEGTILMGDGIFGYANTSTELHGVALVEGNRAIASFDDSIRDSFGQLVALELRAPGALPAVVQVEELASISRRVAAKLIDLVGVGFTAVGFSSLFHSRLAGLIIGWAWFLATDWGATIGKSLLGVAVVDAQTGTPCTFKQSVIRNFGVFVLSFPTRAHQAILGLERSAYLQSHRLLLLVSGALTAGMVVLEWSAAFRSPRGQRVGDVWAGTVVVRKRKKRGP